MEKIKIKCPDCGKTFQTTQEWFDEKNVDGKLNCKKCKSSSGRYIKPEEGTEGAKKIDIKCSNCDKKFKTTKAWFEQKNVDGKLKCRKCRLSK